MSSKIIAGTTSGTALNLFSDTSGILEIQTGSGPTTAITVDGSQNVGVGVTPAAWNTTYKSIQVNTTGAVVGAPTSCYLSNNWYQNGTATNKYLITGASGLAGWEGNTFKWYTAPSGTAGTNISFFQAMTLDDGGNLLIGTATQRGKVTANLGAVNGVCFDGTFSIGEGNAGCFRSNYTNTTGTAYHAIFAYNSGIAGAITSTSTTTTYVTSSDYRLKEDIAPISNALSKVSALKPVTYKWKIDGSKGEGFIAHELAEICPQAVIGEKDAVNEDGTPKYQGIDTSFLVATLVAAIQELKAEVDALKGTK